jgi:hypothetical protein
VATENLHRVIANLKRNARNKFGTLIVYRCVLCFGYYHLGNNSELGTNKRGPHKEQDYGA